MRSLMPAGYAEERGDELAGAVRLVAAGEAARQDRPSARLRIALCELARAVSASACAERLRITKISGLAAVRLERAGGVVLAVGAREYRDQRRGGFALRDCRSSDTLRSREGNAWCRCARCNCLASGTRSRARPSIGARQLVDARRTRRNRDLRHHRWSSRQPAEKPAVRTAAFDQECRR